MSVTELQMKKNLFFLWCPLKPLASLSNTRDPESTVTHDHRYPGLSLCRHSEAGGRSPGSPGGAQSTKNPLAAPTPPVAIGLTKPVPP